VPDVNSSLPAGRRSLLLIAIRPRNSAIRCFLLYFQQTPALPFPMVAPVPAQISKLPCRKLSGPTRRSCPNSRPVNPLQPLCRYSVAPVLYFQQLAASFHKTPGWGVPRFPFQPPTAHPLLTTRLALTTFRMNTCKSVSRQTTLTTFRMNTYEKPGEGGTRHLRAAHTLPIGSVKCHR
jgi:hypothetical protein